MRALTVVLFLFAYALAAPAQRREITVTGDAEVRVPPDIVEISLGVEARNKVLVSAKDENDRAVRNVLATIQKFQVPPGDVQTGFINVDIQYNPSAQAVVDHYSVEKGVTVTLRDVSKFEALLTAALDAGANHVYDVEFRTSELRKYRDQARGLAAKAAIEKANDLASVAGMKVSAKPTGISSYNYQGGYWSSRRRTQSNFSQNVLQNGSAGAPEGTVALGKVSVSASVTMEFMLE